MSDERINIPKTPAGLEPRGRKLWRSIHEQHPAITDPEREVVLEACRVADRLERLDAVCKVSEPVIESRTGLIAHPAFAEARQQQNLLKQLVASLRIPDADTGKRPQYRGTRGVQQPKGAGKAAGNVTALDRFRQAAGG